MKITYCAATSQDGFIAREDGDVSWLEEYEDAPQSHLAKLFQEIDALVMGRRTYDFIHDHGTWPYEDKPAWVFTRRKLTALPGASLIPTTSISSLMEQANERGIRHLWLLGGGELASQFLENGLLTRIVVTELPIKLRKGLPLFKRHRLEEFASARVEIFGVYRQVEIPLSISR
ncbi:MAG: dihydrofolate reductase family protein [Planctomycetota bacterium]